MLNFVPQSTVLSFTTPAACFEDADTAEQADSTSASKKIKLVCVSSHKKTHRCIQLQTDGCVKDKTQLIEFPTKPDGEYEERFQELANLVEHMIPDVDKVSRIPKDIILGFRQVMKETRDAWAKSSHG